MAAVSRVPSGSVCIARQKIQVGIGHAGQTVTVEQADTTFRVYLGEQLLTEVSRTTTKTIARFKVRQPEPPRRALPAAGAGPVPQHQQDDR